MRISKFIKALIEWMFAPRFYYHWKGFTSGTVYEPLQMKAEYKFGKKLRKQKCKQCNSEFWAFKRNDTCPSIKCFFNYRMKGE
jgi:hypothetical protein